MIFFLIMSIKCRIWYIFFRNGKILFSFDFLTILLKSPSEIIYFAEKRHFRHTLLRSDPLGVDFNRGAKPAYRNGRFFFNLHVFADSSLYLECLCAAYLYRYIFPAYMAVFPGWKNQYNVPSTSIYWSRCVCFRETGRICAKVCLRHY